MKILSTLATASAVAILAGCGGSNLPVRAPSPPEQKTQLHPEDARSYDIRQLSAAVADDQQALYEAQRNVSLVLACVADKDWEVNGPDEPQVIATVKGPELQPNEAAAVNGTLEYFNGAFRQIEQEYARFQDFRRLYDAAQHDQRLLRVAIQQGLSVLYAGRRVLDFSNSFEAGGCSLKPLHKGLKAVGDVVSDVGQGQLPALMRMFDENGDHWGSVLLSIQHAVVAGQDAITPCANASRELDGASTQYDTSILTWCGYAAAHAGQSDQANKFYAQAGQSVHDPEGASYALARVRDTGDAAKAGKVTLVAIKSE
jgi:hypothetical protein